MGSAPPKVGGSHFGIAANSAVPGTSKGALCYVSDIGGQMISVCRIGGYEMPSFIFWASLLIFLIFASASLMLLFQCNRVASSLKDLSKVLESISPAQGQPITPLELSRIGEKMRTEKLTSSAWNEFESTLLPSPDLNKIYTTCSVDSVLSKNALIDENVNGALFAAIPGVLTGVGLLMTFVAILDGLSHVSVGANMDVQGIGGLINGLSGKFVSSIVAVTCAVAFVFVERIAYARPQDAYRKLIASLSPRFKRRTTEHLLQSIETQFIAVSQALNELKSPSTKPSGRATGS